jgi:branched-chain amino acid transport system permease protein
MAGHSMNRLPVIATAHCGIDRLRLTPVGANCLIVALLASAPLWVSQYFATDILARAMLLAILALALDLAWGYGGILSLGHSAFFGVGAYAMAIVALHWDSGLAPYVGFVLAILLPAVLAVVVGWFIFFGATSSLYVAIVTLSLPVLLSAIDLRIPKLTGGLTGLSGIPSFPWAEPLYTYYLLLGALMLAIGIVMWIVRSDFGRLLVAVRDNEERARFFGYNTPTLRLFVFVVSAGLAGYAGALYAPYNGFVSHDLLGLVLSTSAIVWVAIGGRGTVAGPVAGALLVNILEPTLNAAFPGFWQLVLGFVFIVVVLLLPSGLFGLVRSQRRPGRTFQIVDAPPRQRTHDRMTVVARKLNLSFGSLAVLRELDLEIETGKLHCLIGPNGAGKSTLVDVMTGRLRPSSGEIIIDGAQAAVLPPDVIVHRGVMRTFQASNVFETQRIGDNLFLAAYNRELVLLARWTNEIVMPSHARRVLELSGLDRKLDTFAGELGHGERKWLELCMVLTAQPAIVILDEPTAGLSSIDRANAGDVLIALVREHGLGLLLIEHDLDFVKSIAERLTVLSQGTIVADGSVQAVAESPVVRQIYLGQTIARTSGGCG